MKVIVFGIFVATMLKFQQFVISKPDRHRRRAAIHQVCQHWLRPTSRYLQHPMTSALCHN